MVTLFDIRDNSSLTRRIARPWLVEKLEMAQKKLSCAGVFRCAQDDPSKPKATNCAQDHPSKPKAQDDPSKSKEMNCARGVVAHAISLWGERLGCRR
jgi:hypothetical protein